MSEKQTEIKSVKYLSAEELSEMKEVLGQILIALQCPLTPKERQEFWQCFESLLAQYTERRIKEKDGQIPGFPPARE
jgi:hypothetical protein